MKISQPRNMHMYSRPHNLLTNFRPQKPKPQFAANSVLPQDFPFLKSAVNRGFTVL